MIRGKARTPRKVQKPSTARKVSIGGSGSTQLPPTPPSFSKAVLEAYVKASNTEAGDRFGDSVALDGDTLVVGTPYEDSSATGISGDQFDNSFVDSGAVYIFTRINGVWSQQAYIKASNTGAGDHFGASVAISGNTLVVGAPDEGSNATGINGDQSNNNALKSGAVYVFTRRLFASGTKWIQQAYIKASNTDAGDHFGSSVALEGDTLAVGAPDEDSNAIGINSNQSDNSAENSGAVYVFTRANGAWSQQAYVKVSKPPDVYVDPVMDWTAQGWRFGASVALSSETLAVGATDALLLSDKNGAVYIFTRTITIVGGRPGVKWKQQAFIGAPNQGIGYRFGHSVALSGETLVAGDHSTNEVARQCGAVHVFTRTNGVWTKKRSLFASNPGESDIFGKSVALSGETLAVGAHWEDSSATGINGNQADNSASNSGGVYVFTRTGSAAVLASKWGWKQHVYVKASNTETGDEFGFSVAVSGDTMVVGATGESSNATGINGNQSDNSAYESGAVYVYRAK